MHSAILSPFIKLQFVIKICVLSIFEWPFYTGFYCTQGHSPRPRVIDLLIPENETLVERLFLAVPRGCLRFVIVVFPDHTHLLFLKHVYLIWAR